MVYKKLLVLLLVVAVSQAQSNYTNSTVHVDDYLTAIRRQHDDIVKDYVYKLEAFEELYTGRIDTIDVQLEFLLNSIKQTDDRLYALEMLSDFSKGCVEKYNSELPSAVATTAAVNNCTTVAKNRLPSIMTATLATRNNLTYYYNNTFEMELKKCGNNSNSSSQLNYTLCVTTVVANADIYTINNQKLFDYQMDAATCTANGYVKVALDCSFMAQTNVMSMMAGTNTLIDRCMQGSDCSPCTGYYCENVERMPAYMVNNKNQTMTNPFYGRNETLSCLMLDIV